MKAMINQTHVEGYVYEHKLELRTAGPNSKNPGVQFVNGDLSVATDDEMLNVIQVHFSYVTPTTSKGKPNATYNVLVAIIEGKTGNVMEHGKENAGKVRIDSAIGLNEWYDMRTKDTPLVSVKRNEGGFVHSVAALGDSNARSTFNTDMLITGTRRLEANEERQLPERLMIKGYIFDFRKAIMPVEFTVINPRAIDYFEGLDPRENMPVFTRVQGKQVCQTITRTLKEESAFGDAAVRTVNSTLRDFVVTWAQPNPYEWDTNETILASEVKEAMSNREVYLADLKKRREEYDAANGKTPTASTSAAAPAHGPFNDF